MPYAIARMKKLKTVAAARWTMSHHRRMKREPHQDPARGVRVLHGQHDGREATERMMGMWPQKRRKDAVLGIEVLLTASPEFFRPDAPQASGTWRDDRLKAWEARAMAFLQLEYQDNLVSVVVHLDEATPHLQAVVVPLVNGKLNAKKVMGGPDQLRAWQDRYHQSVAELGLERGLKGSRARHESVKKFYAAVNQPLLPAVDAVPPPPQPLSGLDAINPTARARYKTALENHERQRQERAEAIGQRQAQLEEQAKAAHLQRQTSAAMRTSASRATARLDEVTSQNAMHAVAASTEQAVRFQMSRRLQEVEAQLVAANAALSREVETRRATEQKLAQLTLALAPSDFHRHQSLLDDLARQGQESLGSPAADAPSPKLRPR